MIGKLRAAFAGATPRGQVLVISLAGMIIVLLMLGLAIDGGRGYWERRQAENAAEHAALAAAWESCRLDHPDPGNRDPVGVAETTAALNGFTDDGVTTSVTVTGSSGTYAVVVQTELATAFASLMGSESMAISGRAVADCEDTSGAGFALFAGGNWCPPGKNMLQISGGENTITGKVHSNANLYVSGQDNELNGGTTYVTTINEGDNDFNPGAQPSGILPWPDVAGAFDATDYKAMAQSGSPNMYFKSGDMDWSWIQARGARGLFYATGKIDFGVSGRTANVTLVSESNIVINGSTNNLTPFVGNLLAFSKVVQPANDRCDKQGVEMNGSTNTWAGFIYAPRSNIKMDGSTGSTLLGSLIGWSINLSGQALNNTADPAPDPGPPILRLME